MASTSEAKSSGAALFSMQTHSRDKLKLCEDIVFDHFGPTAARVASTLLQRGRLSLPILMRFLATTTAVATAGLTAADLTRTSSGNEANAEAAAAAQAAQSNANAPLKNKRLIQQTLMVFVQHHLAWHVRLDGDGAILPDEEEGGTEYFEMNPDAILPRLRFGRYISLAKQKWHEEGRAIIELVLAHGKLQAGDIIDRLADDDETKRYSIAILLRKLLWNAYLRPSTLAQHRNPRDKEIAYSLIEQKMTKQILTPKQMQGIRERVAERIAKEEMEDWEGQAMAPGGVFGGGSGRLGLLKRKAPKGGSKKKSSSSKKQKGENGKARDVSTAAGDDEEDAKLEELEIDPEIFLRVHCDRFDVHLRDGIIYDAASAKWNSHLADVLREMIIYAELKTERPNVKDEISASFSLNSLASRLPSDLSLSKGWDKQYMRNNGLKSSSDRFELLKEYAGVLSEADYTHGPMHAETRFLTPEGGSLMSSATGARVGQSFVVEYKNIGRKLKRKILIDVVEQQFGTSGVRIINILFDKGKLEEKHIAKISLLTPSETRDVCARMFASSLISMQEVPKSNDRSNAQRIFFLWFIDEAKSRAWLLDHLYKTLARHGQRRREEARKVESLTRKAERTDVKNAAESLLAEHEIKSLQRLENSLTKLTVAEMRCDLDAFTVSLLPG